MYYTILMNADKSLTNTVTPTVFQGEHLADVLRFLIPLKYKDYEVRLRYIDQANCPHSEILTLSPDLYEDYLLCYYLPVDSELTKFAGEITLRLAFKEDERINGRRPTVYSGRTTIVIEPNDDIGRFIESEAFENFAHMYEDLEDRIDTLDMMKADNIKAEDNKIQLTSNGKPIGDAVEIKTDYSSCMRFNDADDAAQYAMKKGEPGEIIVVKLDGKWIAHVIEDDKAITPICYSNGQMVEIVFDGDDADGINEDIEITYFDGGSAFGL